MTFYGDQRVNGDILSDVLFSFTGVWVWWEVGVQIALPHNEHYGRGPHPDALLRALIGRSIESNMASFHEHNYLCILFLQHMSYLPYDYMAVSTRLPG